MKKRTSSNRSALTFAFANSLIFPFTIQSDTVTGQISVIVTPNNGSTFGWRRDFHSTASLQNFCTGHCQPADIHDEWRTTHMFNPLNGSVLMSPQNLSCNPPATILTLPYVCKPTTAYRARRWAVTKGNRQRSRKHAVVGTHYS